MKILVALIISFCFSYTAFSQCVNTRYKEKIFNDITVIKNIKYGSNINNVGKEQDLFLDVYMPSLTEDTLLERPVIFFIHGGSFVEGSKEFPVIKNMCREFASRGYVSIAIQYRIELAADGAINPILQFADRNNWYKAIIRGSQDVRGSIRYIKYDVAENNNPFHIDTNNITLYGSSAGGIATMHATYLDDSDSLNLYWINSVNALGGLEGNTSTHLEYGSVNTVRNLIICSGAITDVNWIGNKKEVDVIGFHYNLDPSVPFGHGCFYTAACHLGRFDGMKIYGPYLDNIGTRIEYYIAEGIGHPYDELQPENVLEKSVNFMYASQCKYDSTVFTIPTGIKSNVMNSMKIYPNPTSNGFRIELPSTNSGNLTLEIFSFNGQLFFQEKLNGNQTIYENNTPLNKGMYLIKISDGGQNSKVQKLIVQ